MSRNLVANNNGQSETGGGNNNRTALSLGDIWEDLCVGIESIYQQQTMSKARYMILYS